MSTKLIIKEGYNGDPIGEQDLIPSLSIDEIRSKLPTEIILSIRDSDKFKCLEEIEIIGSELILSLELNNYNWFECYCILEKLYESTKQLEVFLKKDILINDYKKRTEETVFMEVDSTFPYCIISIPLEKGVTFSKVLSITTSVEQVINSLVTDVLEVSKNTKSYPKPDNPYHTRKTKLFLSHSSKDKKIVRQILDDLKENDFETWFDEDNILVGQDFIDQIQNGIRESDFLILIMSKNFIDFGPWAKEEYKIALSEQISKNLTKILPVLIDNCEIPDFLKSKHYADFRDDYQYGLHKLINSIKRLKK